MFLLLLKILLIFLIGHFLYNAFTCQSTVVASIVGSLIVSLVMMVLTFQYNLRKQSIRNYLDSLRRCQWMMKQNLTILKVAVNKSDIELGIAAKSLKDLEPYLPDHFGYLDDMFRDNLLQCQNYINQCRLEPKLLKGEFTEKVFESNLSNIEGQIEFIKEFADKRFFVWYFLNPVFSFIGKKVLEEKKDNQDKTPKND